MNNIDKYLKAVKENICSICVDSNTEGGCTLTDKEKCAVEIFLPEIIDIIHNSSSDDIYDLHQALREKVCTECRTSEDKDNCYLRNDSNCALDRYYSLIVETVHKVDQSDLE